MYFLGIDGGGTKTRCAVGDEERLLGEASGPGCNLVRTPADRVADSIRSAIVAACKTAGIASSQIVCTCIGTAGISSPDVANQIGNMIAATVPGQVIVRGDNEIAMHAAFGDGPGVIVASGTGSIAYGRTEDGRTARAGGYGHAISDEGSGHWIGRTAVSRTLRAFDCGQKTLLEPYLLEAWQADSCAHLVKRANGAPDFAALYPLVLRAANDGDAIACELLRQAGRELAVLAARVLQQLCPEHAQLEVATVGGVFASSAAIRNEFRSKLLSDYPELTIQPSVSEPVLGALSMARKEFAKFPCRV